MRVLKLALFLAVGFLVMTLYSGYARADYTFDIGVPNTAIAGYTGPYASVDVNLTDATHATVTFTSLTNGGNIYLLGDGGTADVNVNASTWNVGSFSSSNSGTGFISGPVSGNGSGNISTFGVFNQTTKSFDGFTHSSDLVSFVLQNTSGTWATANNVLTPNADGYLAAAHIFVTPFPADASNGALATGFAANGSTVPEPSPLLLLGVALLGLALVSRWKLTKA